MGSRIIELVPLFVLFPVIFLVIIRVVRNRKKTKILKTAYEEALKGVDKQNEINAGLAYYA
jgi:hypothetical protein